MCAGFSTGLLHVRLSGSISQVFDVLVNHCAVLLDRRITRAALCHDHPHRRPGDHLVHSHHHAPALPHWVPGVPSACVLQVDAAPFLSTVCAP